MYLWIDAKGAELTEGLRSLVRRCLLRVLARFEAHLCTVHVRLADGRVGDVGEVDCELTAHRAWGRPLVSRASAPDVLSAVDGAGTRLREMMRQESEPGAEWRADAGRQPA